MQSSKEEVNKILDAFARQELGNRLSEFAMMSLRSMIIHKIDEADKRAKEQCPSTNE